MEKLSVVYIARHGNTAWTHSGQRNGLNDLPLRPNGERSAVRLGERRKGIRSMTSTLERSAPNASPDRLKLMAAKEDRPKDEGWE